MKNALIFAGLVTLSVLYLFEVDFSNISWMNVAAFFIIALTLIPLLSKIVSGIVRKSRGNSKKKADADQSASD